MTRNGIRNAMCAILLCIAPAASTAAVGDDAALLRSALAQYLAGLPAPVTKAEKQLRAKLEQALDLLESPPGSLADEIQAVAAAFKLLPSPAAGDPDIDAAADAVLPSLVAQLESALVRIEEDLAVHGDPGPAPLAAVRAQIAKCRAKLAAAADASLDGTTRFAALGKAGAKFLAASERYAAFEDSLFECEPAQRSDGILQGRASMSVDGGPEVELPAMAALGSGTPASSGFSASALAEGAEFSFNVRGTPLLPGETPTVTDVFDFTRGVRVFFSHGGSSYLCDTGTFTIRSIRLRKYPKPVTEPHTRYLEIRGTFTGSGYEIDSQMQERASISADFAFCEIPYDPR